MHDEELEKQVFSDSLLQLWQTGGDAVRANATNEHHDVRQPMHAYTNTMYILLHVRFNILYFALYT